MPAVRLQAKRALGLLGRSRAAAGATMLIYHRVGGGSSDEMDTPLDSFQRQLDVLADHDVVALDTALDRLEAGDDRPTVVLTFDDGFAEVHRSAWPLLAERCLPFTVYLTAGCVGGRVSWEGSAAGSQGASALDWAQLAGMAASGLCTVGNHTWSHPPPGGLTAGELDRCSDAIEEHLGTRPRHFAYTWGIEVPSMRPAVGARFRSAVTGRLGRNLPGGDLLALRRVPVRRTDPIEFFAAKLRGRLLPEKAYAAMVGAAKRLGARA